MNTVAFAPLVGNEKRALSSMLEAALAYARKGWSVFPVYEPNGDGCSCGKSACQSIGKHPRTQHGCKDASTNEEQIRAWWQQWPTANIGIATGRPSNVFVVDIDGERGQSSFDSFTASRPLPQMYRVLTGRREPDGSGRSFHLYFKLPTTANVRSSTGLLGVGVDIRGDGGYVVAPPSLHQSGMCYELMICYGELVEAPDWLLVQVSEAITSRSFVGNDLVYPGNRYNTLFALATRMRQRGILRADLETKICAVNERRCRPPLAETEIDRLLKGLHNLPLLGPDRLQAAWERVEAIRPSSTYLALVALACKLQELQPGIPILLPVERVAKFLRCHRTMVGRYRGKAVKDGYIEEVGHYIAHQTAKKYRVLPAAFDAVSFRCLSKRFI